MVWEARWQECGLPENLGDWVGQERLIDLTLNAVDTLEEGRLDHACSEPVMPPLPARVTLMLMVYCYAAGVYGSHQIADRLQRDAVLRYLTIGRNPGAEHLRRFRNRNRELIAGCLGRVCCEAGRLRLVAPWAAARAGREPSSRFETLVELHCLCEARQRVTQAEQADEACFLSLAIRVPLSP